MDFIYTLYIRKPDFKKLHGLIIILAIIPVLFFSCNSGINKISEKKDKTTVSDNKINMLYDLTINGTDQMVLIESNDIENNPVLLYLHGGPGSSVMMYSYLYPEQLKDNFIFVNWDMRGAALSFHEGLDPDTVSEGQIAEDAFYLIHYLMDKFNKEKIYILGHSFGSVLGMHLIDNYPELFYAYIGVGQVINYKESVPVTYKWLHDTLIRAGDNEALERIERDRFPYIDLVVKYGGHHRLSLDLNSIIQKSPYYFEGYPDLLSKGKKFSAANVSRNPKTFKAPSEIRKTTVPLYFFEGRNDHVTACAPELVTDYCKTVEAPVKKIIWFENSAHYINVEEPDKFSEELIKIKNLHTIFMKTSQELK